MKDMIIERFEFDFEHKDYYGIYEYASKEEKTEENFIDDKIKVMDVIGSWANEVDFLKLKFPDKEIDIKFWIYFKIRFFFKFKDISTKFLNFYQIIHQFMRNRFNIEYEKWIKICALKIFIEFGENNDVI